ncbi:MAG: sulfotransferase [Coxiellaceae bacterium]|nr:sulfotransferase [Coxiellaceae bacterium]
MENKEITFNETDKWLVENCFKIDEVLAIVFLGRSGSVFLGSLLDNHPQVIMLPGTQLAFYDFFWEKYSGLSNVENLVNTFCAYFSSFFDVHAFSPLSLGTQPSLDLGFSSMGEDRNEKVEIDKEKFKKIMYCILSKISHVNKKNFFQAIHVAYTISNDNSSRLDKNRLPLIVYQLHMNWENLVTSLVSDFPKTKFIHMIREPFQTVGSHFKHTNYRANVMNYFYRDAFPYAENSASKAIKLEDLHTQPTEVMKKISDWINIGWSDSLMESTFNGKKWWNLKDVEQVSGFNKVIISKNHSSLYYKFDKYRLEILYSKRFKLWGYSSKTYSKLDHFIALPLLLFPFKMEIISYRNAFSITKLHGLKNIVLDLFSKKRFYLFSAWKYSLSKEVREVRLL